MAKKTGKKTGKLDLFPIINGIIMVLFIVITPLTYMVITQNKDNSFLNRKRFLLTINARIAFATSASSVPMMVRATVIYAPVIRLSF